MDDVDRPSDTIPPASADQVERRRLGLERLALISQIVGTVALVVSLVYVGLQLQQATHQLERQENNATQDQWQAIRLAIATDPDLARIWQAGLAGDSLDATGRYRFGALLSEHTWATFHIWDRTRLGIFEPSEFMRGAAPPLARWLCTPGGAAWWSGQRGGYPPGFVEDMDKAMGQRAAAEGVECPLP